MPSSKKYGRLEGRRVLCIGGTSGIGFCIAEACLENGASVIVSSSNQGRLNSVVAELRKSSSSDDIEISGHPCDLSNDDTLEANLVLLLKQATNDAQHKLDHITFTAADALPQLPIQDVSIKSLHNVGRIRFFAPLLLAKHASQYMVPGYESSFTLATGSVSERPILNWSVIGSFAGGHHSMARGLALDLAPLRFNAVSPGVVDTGLWNDMNADDKAAMFKSIEDKTPTGRIAKPEDIAEAFLYLMRDYNATGSVVSTNGGHLLV